MNLLFLSVTSSIICVLVALALKYLSLLRWISGHAYVLSKRKEFFTILEVLDLFKNVRPFPISTHKGWKIDNYTHGHRIWFNFLTFPYNINAPSIKVYAVFGRIRSSSQALLHVLKDIGQSCEWKPGVVSTSHTHNLTSYEVPSLMEGVPSMPVQVDCVKEERLNPAQSKLSLQYRDPWHTENVVPTISVEFKRFWHREDNGVCWLLQMNEKQQSCEFFLIQPVEELDHCLLSVVTWSHISYAGSVERASILLSSLDEYITLRKVQKTPLNTITLPQDLSDSGGESTDSNQHHESFSQDMPLLSKFRNFIRDKKPNGERASRRPDVEKYATILRYGSRTDSPVTGGDEGSDSVDASQRDETEEGAKVAGHKKKRKSLLARSLSDGAVLKQSRAANKQLEQRKTEEDILEDIEDDENLEADDEEDTDGETLNEDIPDSIDDEDLKFARYKTISNQCAGEIMAEAMRASNIDLKLSPEEQAESSGGWLFSSFEKNIIILKKAPKPGSTVQSYLGKGFVLAPPKTVWDAVKNPRTKFTYDDTLKKVDILESIGNSLKIVYLYHESVQFLMKENCDMCVLQGERLDGDKYVLTYSSVEHNNCEPRPNVTRAKFLPSGWIIEPAKQDNKVYSIVTYLMQLDFGPPKDNSGKLPFEDMISRHPLSIADLQQYLKPAVQLLRAKSCIK